MKKHAIIPIFIPHLGCPHACVFCNQREITARTAAPTPEDVRKTIETWLTTLGGVETVEAAFYGGSFTGLTIEEQSSYLAVAKEFLDAGKIDAIHLSTRPDYIDREILDNLKAYGVRTIELGVQSFDDEVLRRSNRGHTAEDVYRAVDLIREYGFELGIQLMIGLPGDSEETCIESAKKTAEIGPELARLYPTIVLDDTELYDMYERGEYVPLTREEAVRITKEMYEILDEAGITIMRVGLKSTDIIGDGGAVNGGTYHPAFRQLVEGSIARDRIEPLLEEIEGSAGAQGGRLKVDVFTAPSWYSNAVGNRSVNRRYFEERFPKLDIKFRPDETLEPGRFRAEAKPDESRSRFLRRKERVMEQREKAVVSVVGRDRVGILAEVAGTCAEVKANVVDVTQSVMSGFFTMMMVIDITDMEGLIVDLQAKLDERLPGIEVHVMHENIFESMHRI